MRHRRGGVIGTGAYAAAGGGDRTGLRRWKAPRRGPEGGRRHTHRPLESAAEMALIGEPGVERHIGYRSIRVRQRAAGQLEPELTDRGREGPSEVAPEAGGQVHGMN